MFNAGKALKKQDGLTQQPLSRQQKTTLPPCSLTLVMLESNPVVVETEAFHLASEWTFPSDNTYCVKICERNLEFLAN